jgi:transmembrane sensor
VVKMKSTIVQLPHRGKDKEKNHQECIHDEALEWLVELDLDLTKERETQLQEWMAQSEMHKSIFLEQVQLWDNLNVLSELSKILPYEHFSQKKNVSYLIAASVVFAMFIGVFTFEYYDHNTPSLHAVEVEDTFFTTHSTLKGEIETFKLPDGSLLTLNTDSFISLKFDSRYRNINLKRGELNIDVFKDSKRPMNIIVENKVIQAVGTAFNVQYFNKDIIRLIVTEGKVVLTNKANLDQAQINRKTTKNDTVYLVAGQKVALDSADSTNDIRNNIIEFNQETGHPTSWMQGYISFSGETLQEVVKQINRYTQVQIVLNDERIKSIEVVGRFEVGELDFFLNGLTENFNIKVDKDEITTIRLSLDSL